MMPETTIKHAEQRNFRQVTTFGKNVEYLDATTGETVYRGPVSSHTQPVGERYCDHCGAWKEQKGLFAGLLGCPTCGKDW